jgi:hypothetical protein
MDALQEVPCTRSVSTSQRAGSGYRISRPDAPLSPASFEFSVSSHWHRRFGNTGTHRRGAGTAPPMPGRRRRGAAHLEGDAAMKIFTVLGYSVNDEVLCASCLRSTTGLNPSCVDYNGPPDRPALRRRPHRSRGVLHPLWAVPARAAPRDRGGASSEQPIVPGREDPPPRRQASPPLRSPPARDDPATAQGFRLALGSCRPALVVAGGSARSRPNRPASPSAHARPRSPPVHRWSASALPLRVRPPRYRPPPATQPGS